MATSGKSGTPQFYLAPPAEGDHLASGGDANATAIAQTNGHFGSVANAHADAEAGGGAKVAGIATAIADGIAETGFVEAKAHTERDFISVNATAEAYVFVESVASTRATIAHSLDAFVESGQTVSIVTGLPQHNSVDADLELNGANTVKTVFASPDAFYFAAGELGVSSAKADAPANYTQASHFNFTVDLTKTSVAQTGDVVLALYHLIISGSFNQIDFDVTVNGAKIVDQAFSSAQKFANFMHDKVLDIGDIDGDALTVSVDFSATTGTGQHGSAYFNLIVGGGTISLVTAIGRLDTTFHRMIPASIAV